MENYHTKILKTDDCWYWLGSLDEKGYGRAWYRGRTYKAHRAVYEIVLGDIPKNKELDHLCRNRNCVKPAHLEPVTHKENVRRGNSGWQQKMKTHCKHGHEFDDNNTYYRPGTSQRICKKCALKRTRLWRTNSWRAVAEQWVASFNE